MSTVEESRLNELKMLCTEGETPDEHASHAAELEVAYQAFAGRQVSNPAAPGVTEVSADLVVASEMPGDAPPEGA